MRKLYEVRTLLHHNESQLTRCVSTSIGAALDFVAPDPAPDARFTVSLVGEVTVDQSVPNAKPSFVMVTDEEREIMVNKVVAASSLSFVRAEALVETILGCLAGLSS